MWKRSACHPVGEPLALSTERQPSRSTQPALFDMINSIRRHRILSCRCSCPAIESDSKS